MTNIYLKMVEIVKIRIVDVGFENIIHEVGPFQDVTEAYIACKDVDLPDSRPVKFEILLTMGNLHEVIKVLTKDMFC